MINYIKLYLYYILIKENFINKIIDSNKYNHSTFHHYLNLLNKVNFCLILIMNYFKGSFNNIEL
jgi:hypothetical protein